MKNEPVAWMLTLPDGTHDWILDGNGCEGYIPLYTHPYKPSKSEVDALLDNADYVIGTMREEIEKLKTKTLTDEEIDIALYVADITLNNLSDGDISMERIKAFVRAILRKAQEK